MYCKQCSDWITDSHNQCSTNEIIHKISNTINSNPNQSGNPQPVPFTTALFFLFKNALNNSIKTSGKIEARELSCLLTPFSNPFH